MDARDPDALHDVDLPVFFFGTFMHERVLRSNGIDHGPTTPARLVGHRLTIRPRVNVVADAGHVTYGALAALSPGELDALYGALRRDVGVSYDPVGVRVRLTDGTERDAWCYVSPGLDEGDPDPAYLSELIECARDVGAPPEYLEHIASFGG